jgi:hypothetical protein
MKDLPVAARVYVIAVLAIGAVLVAIFGPAALQNLRSFPLFLTLLLLSSFASALKVNLPLTTSGSTMSVSYAVDFASLLLLGADATMLVAATSAWSQCTFRTQTDRRRTGRCSAWRRWWSRSRQQDSSSPGSAARRPATRIRGKSRGRSSAPR